MPEDNLERQRENHEPPVAINQRGWRYHHLGIPTKTPIPDEKYLEPFKLYVSGFDTSPYGIEWMRYEDGSPVADLIKTVPHIAFEVDDLSEAIHGKKVIIEPNEPGPGTLVAFIEEAGAPIEFLQIEKKREAEPEVK